MKLSLERSKPKIRPEKLKKRQKKMLSGRMTISYSIRRPPAKKLRRTKGPRKRLIKWPSFKLKRKRKRNLLLLCRRRMPKTRVRRPNSTKQLRPKKQHFCANSRLSKRRLLLQSQRRKKKKLEVK